MMGLDVADGRQGARAADVVQRPVDHGQPPCAASSSAISASVSRIRRCRRSRAASSSVPAIESPSQLHPPRCDGSSTRCPAVKIAARPTATRSKRSGRSASARTVPAPQLPASRTPFPVRRYARQARLDPHRAVDERQPSRALRYRRPVDTERPTVLHQLARHRVRSVDLHLEAAAVTGVERLHPDRAGPGTRACVPPVCHRTHTLRTDRTLGRFQGAPVRSLVSASSRPAASDSNRVRLFCDDHRCEGWILP